MKLKDLIGQLKHYHATYGNIEVVVLAGKPKEQKHYYPVGDCYVHCDAEVDKVMVKELQAYPGPNVVILDSFCCAT